MERVLAALVRETGISWEMVGALRGAPAMFAMPDVGTEFRLENAADAFSAILEAAGVPNENGSERDG